MSSSVDSSLDTPFLDSGFRYTYSSLSYSRLGVVQESTDVGVSCTTLEYSVLVGQFSRGSRTSWLCTLYVANGTFVDLKSHQTIYVVIYLCF